MKKLLLFLLGAFLYNSVLSQTVTIRFEGANNNNNANSRDYALEIDGRKYYSTSAEAAGNGVKQFVLTDLSVGAHDLVLYDNAQNEELYSKTFQVRSGYDMIISVRRNGNVAFLERKMKKNTAAANASTPVTDAQFTSILQSIKSKWSQSSRMTAAKSAISNKAYYFTTDQVGQILMLVNTDARRLELAKLAYSKVTDRTNYSDIAELFTSQSSKDQFNSYIGNSGSLGTTGQYASRIAMTDADFTKIYNKARLHFRQSSTITDVRNAFSNKSYYFTLEQTRALLSLISSESDRLTLAKLAYHRAADPTSFSQISDVFSSQASINELNNYIRNNPS